MKIQDVLGVRVLLCRRRENYRTCFYGKNSSMRNAGVTLLWISRGRAEFRLGAGTSVLTAGGLHAWDSGVAREYRALPGQPLSYYLAVLEPLPTPPKKTRISDLGLRPFYRVQGPRALAAIFRELYRVFNGKDRLRVQRASILGLKLLLTLEPQTGFLPGPSEGPDDRPARERIFDVLDYINTNYKKRLSVRTLAARAAMHPVHLTRLFKKVTGLAPHRYVLEKKIEKARDFILQYGESLTTTALELGFHDYAHFYRVCRRLTGKSPLDYFNRRESA